MLRHYEHQHPSTNSEVSRNNSIQTHDIIDLRLIPNFKILVAGPSRCGKTWFTFNLIPNAPWVDTKEEVIHSWGT